MSEHMDTIKRVLDGDYKTHFANGRAVDEAKLQEMFKSVYKAKKSEKSSSNKHNKSLKQRLEELKEARKDGLINEQEFEAKKAKLLADF